MNAGATWSPHNLTTVHPRSCTSCFTFAEAPSRLSGDEHPMNSPFRGVFRRRRGSTGRVRTWGGVRCPGWSKLGGAKHVEEADACCWVVAMAAMFAPVGATAAPAMPQSQSSMWAPARWCKRRSTAAAAIGATSVPTAGAGARPASSAAWAARLLKACNSAIDRRGQAASSPFAFSARVRAGSRIASLRSASGMTGGSQVGRDAPGDAGVHPGGGGGDAAEAVEVHADDVAGAARARVAGKGGELVGGVDVGEEAHRAHALGLQGAQRR